MKTYQAARALGFFDVELRVQWLEAKGNPLSRLEAVIDWERFRPLLEPALAKPARGPGGRRAHDPLKMFKLLVVQRYYNLSDEQTEYQVSDRLSCQKFAGWTVADTGSDANTATELPRGERDDQGGRRERAVAATTASTPGKALAD